MQEKVAEATKEALFGFGGDSDKVKELKWEVKKWKNSYHEHDSHLNDAYAERDSYADIVAEAAPHLMGDVKKLYKSRIEKK